MRLRGYSHRDFVKIACAGCRPLGQLAGVDPAAASATSIDGSAQPRCRAARRRAATNRSSGVDSFDGTYDSFALKRGMLPA